MKFMRDDVSCCGLRSVGAPDAVVTSGVFPCLDLDYYLQLPFYGFRFFTFFNSFAKHTLYAPGPCINFTFEQVSCKSSRSARLNPAKLGAFGAAFSASTCF